MGRVLRSNLPVCTAILQLSTPKNVQEALKGHQLLQKKAYDRAASPPSPLREGMRVCMDTAEGWKPATVVRVRDEPRSYDVVTSTGARYRRNRRHLRPDRTTGHHEEPQEVSYPDSVADTEPMSDNEQDTSNVCCQEPLEVETQTRSGCTTKLPARLKDYVLK